MKPIILHVGLFAFAALPLVGAESPAVFYQARPIYKSLVAEQEQQQKQTITLGAMEWATVTDGAYMDTEDNSWVCLSPEAWKDEQCSTILEAYVGQMLKAKRVWTETEKAVLQRALTTFAENSSHPDLSDFRQHLAAFYHQAFLTDSIDQLEQNRIICAILHPLLEQDKRIDDFSATSLAKKFNRREIYLRALPSTPGDTIKKARQKNDF